MYQLFTLYKYSLNKDEASAVVLLDAQGIDKLLGSIYNPSVDCAVSNT